MHEKFIFERNIRHFLTLLDSATDLDRARVLERLLDAERDGLAALEAAAGPGLSTPATSASKP